MKIARQSKYRNVATVVDGVRFASKAEAARDAELLLMEKAGVIGDIRRQPRFPLIVNGVKICVYVADWGYLDFENISGSIHVVEDKKGIRTAAFKIKWRLAKALYPEIEWRLS